MKKKIQKLVLCEIVPLIKLFALILSEMNSILKLVNVFIYYVRQSLQGCN